MPLEPSLRPVRADSRSFKTSAKALGFTIPQSLMQRADQVIDMDRLHLHGEQQLLHPLRLSDAEIDDLVAFLEMLTDPRATAAPGPASLSANCAP